MRKSLISLPITAVSLALLGTVPAHADGHPTPGSTAVQDEGHGAGHGAAPGASARPAPTQSGQRPQDGRSPAVNKARNKPVFLVARLSGANEVPASAGDADGSGTALLRVQGDRVTFALDWAGITAPTLGHIHRGPAGVNGDVAVPLFTSAMPATVTSAAGAVTVADPTIADGLRAHPGNWYVNLHTKENPKGAVRAQLAPLGARRDVLRLLKTGGRRAFMSGDQEVPVKGGPAVGDPDGRAIAFVRPAGTGSLRFSMAWIGVVPSLAHLHRGGFGTNGPVAADLVTTAVPGTIFAVAGTATGVEPSVVQGVRANPRNWYANIHSTEFPGGAVRGQLNG
ncbi:CHRD domain-containing protein [Actinomadura chibensis]|uniref:CHRD domain-containing protein n=1 Tax=Actinomadura chibensis TaxID=392828 RepID=A0A5D0NM45_9ACTN|nr:CHRD domain-containing protein [Actinomadura chibensis]TYB45573.1 CHRD domain-containing protein [Actinomadura chibensis]